MEVNGNNARLRIYLGEDKQHDGRPLYEVIVLKARQLQLAGATVVRGSQGYGRSTRLHTTEVVFSEDLPVVIEIIDGVENIRKFAALLDEIDEIGLVICDEVSVLRYRPIAR
jgi:PII-like signaling protein